MSIATGRFATVSVEVGGQELTFETGKLAKQADGAVVVGFVGFSESSSGNEAFLWDAAHGMRNLREVLISQGADLAGWSLRSANGVAVAPDGTITVVGTGTNPAGQDEAWLARL